MAEHIPEQVPRFTAAALLQLADLLRYLESKVGAGAAREADAVTPADEGGPGELQGPRADAPRPVKPTTIHPPASRRPGQHDRHGEGGR